MIPAARGWYAGFTNEKYGYVDEPIVGWDDRGRPLVADEATGQLVVANERPGFAAVARNDGLKYRGFIPATEGWAARIPTDNKEGGDFQLHPVVGFWIDDMGIVGPIAVNRLGEIFLSTAKVQPVPEQERDEFLRQYQAAADAAQDERLRRLLAP